MGNANRYGSGGDSLFGVPFAGRWAGLGMFQLFGIVLAVFVAALSAASWSESGGPIPPPALVAFGLAPVVVAAGLHPIVAAVAFQGPALGLFQRRPGGVVAVYPHIYGATLDVAHLRSTEPWGETALHLRCRWAFPWSCHSLEVGFQTRSRLTVYASARGSWFADARSSAARDSVREWLHRMRQHCGQGIHLSIVDGQVRVAMHGLPSVKKCWSVLGPELARLAEIVGAADVRTSGYRDGTGDAAATLAARSRSTRTSLLQVEDPKAWWLPIGRERKWFREDLVAVEPQGGAA